MNISIATLKLIQTAKIVSLKKFKIIHGFTFCEQNRKLDVYVKVPPQNMKNLKASKT